MKDYGLPNPFIPVEPQVIESAHERGTTMKLYAVTTLLRKCGGRKDVMYRWFYDDPRSQPRPYAELIENYDPDDASMVYAASYVDELFTEDEAHRLKDHLDRTYGDVGMTAIKEVRLPVPNTVTGVGAIAVGGSWPLLRDRIGEVQVRKEPAST